MNAPFGGESQVQLLPGEELQTDAEVDEQGELGIDGEAVIGPIACLTS